MRAVVITTENRGVFFGYVEDGKDAELPTEIELKSARMCVMWSSSVRGVLGLAATGPNRECRITKKVPAITLYKITSVTDCTPEAVEEWEKGHWTE